MYPELTLYLDGRFIPADGRHTQTVTNPATGEVLGQLPHATPQDLNLALSSAQSAFVQWRRVPAHERSRILLRAGELIRERADSIARDLTLDQGKPLAEALREVLTATEHTQWHAEECRRIYGRLIPARVAGAHQYVVREPTGVCAAFTPWNFPINQAIRKVSAALGAGCTIILKGPEDTPSAIVAMAQAFHDAGLPRGCLNLVWGVPAEVSAHLIRSPIVRKVSFTGSVPVGRQLASFAAQHMKRTTMELGGHSPAIVFDDADVDLAADQLCAFKYLNAGQVCVAPSRLYVQRAVYDRFMARFLDRVARISLGNGLQASTTMGPLVHRRRARAMADLVDDATAHGAVILAGGSAPESRGHFFAPTVLAEVCDTSQLMTIEPFGPIAPVLRFDTLDEVVARANSLPYGLASYAFTRSASISATVVQALEAGVVTVNHFGFAMAETPFGGIKDSGWGSEGGIETFDGYLNSKFVSQLHGQ